MEGGTSDPIDEVTGEVSAIRENGSFLLAGFGYYDLGRRTSLTRGNGTSTSYAYDAASRLSSLAHDIGGTAHDLTLGFGYNPAGQIVTRTGSNDAYVHAPAELSLSYAANGLNQYSQAGSVAPAYDARGNLVTMGSASYGYASDNQLAARLSAAPCGWRRRGGRARR